MDVHRRTPKTEETEERQEMLLIKTPKAGPQRKLLPQSTQKLLNKIKLQREACRTRYSFFQVDKFTTCCIKKFDKEQKYEENLVFMYEHASTALFMKDKDKTIARITKLQQYKNRHNIHCWLIEMGLNRVRFFEACGRMDANAIIRCLYEMNLFIETTGSVLGWHMLNYAVGTFYLILLKMDTQQAARALANLERLYSCRKPMFDMSGIYNPKVCFEKISNLAFEHFRNAREALLHDRTSEDISYFYNDPQEVIYPLLSMAKVKLFLPEFDHDASDGKKTALIKLLNREDLEVAEQCLGTADKEMEQLQLTARLCGRYNITRAGLAFRKWQWQMKTIQQSPDSQTHTASRSVDIKFIDEAIMYASQAIDDVKNTEFEELVIAAKFQQYLMDAKDKLFRQETHLLVDEVPQPSSNEREITASSENDIRDALAFQKDLDDSDDSVLYSSPESDVVGMDALGVTDLSSGDSNGEERHENSTNVVVVPEGLEKHISVTQLESPSHITLKYTNNMAMLTINDSDFALQTDFSVSDID